jgi:hypothetical protein
MAQNCVDRFCCHMGAALLAPVWLAELPFLLRLGQSADHDGSMAGKPLDNLLASSGAARLSEPVCGGSVRGLATAATCIRRDRIHVRSCDSSLCQRIGALPYSRSDTSALGGAATGLRSKRLEVANRAHGHCCSDQFLLAPGIQRELRAWDWT